MHIGPVFAWVAVITLLLTAAAIIGAAFKTSRDKATLTNLKEAANAWREKSTAQDAEIAELHEQSKADRDLIKDLQAKMAVLQDLVTGRSEIAGLASQMTEMLVEMRVMSGDLHAIRDNAGIR